MDITPLELQRRIRNKTQPFILDVRTPEEYNEFHIENSVLIPHDLILAREQDLPIDKETEIICVCRTSNRSEYAVEVLKQMGYKNAILLSGGIMQYASLANKV